MLKNSIFFLAAALLFISCEKRVFGTESEIKAYMSEEENNLRYEKNVNGVALALQYRPTDLLVNQEAAGDYNERKIDSLRKKYSKYMYFVLSISKNDKEILSSVNDDKEKYGQMINDLAFGMEEKIHLYTEAHDTIAMADFIYPRMYGMSNNTSIMLAFPREKEKLKEPFLYFAFDDFGASTGEVKFKVDTQAILNEPTLEFKK